jgi:hypothetical protein
MKLNTEVAVFASRITAWGFKVYIAQAGHYGFITDESESRVLSFSFSDGGSLSGNYGPPSTTSGTSWRMNLRPHELASAAKVQEALYDMPPNWSKKGWRYVTTVAQHLQHYGSSAQYQLFEG